MHNDMGVELHVLQCVRKEVFLRYAICVFYICDISDIDVKN